jgi:hypothetical protein
MIDFCQANQEFSSNSKFQKIYFTIKEPYEAAIPGVFHGAWYEKARVAAGRKRAAIDFATIFRSQNLASAR